MSDCYNIKIEGVLFIWRNPLPNLKIVKKCKISPEILKILKKVGEELWFVFTFCVYYASFRKIDDLKQDRPSVPLNIRVQTKPKNCDFKIWKQFWSLWASKVFFWMYMVEVSDNSTRPESARPDRQVFVSLIIMRVINYWST